MKINNFSAGPSKIPSEVLKQISRDILEYENLGYSILEMSHRSDIFETILNETKSHLIELLSIPDNYEIIFLQGGATFQNTFIPSNNPNLQKDIVFLLTGSWGRKTYQDFQKSFGVPVPSIEFSNDKFNDLLKKVESMNEKYLYLTSNETIEGIQVRDFNKFKGKKLIIDMSSDICSYKFDWDNISYIYAGAQKNLGIPGVTLCIFEKQFFESNKLTSYMDVNNHIEKNSAFNTPPTFSIFVMLKILQWIASIGGLKEIQKQNTLKATNLYDFLDNNSSHFITNAPIEYRSYANIVFDFKDRKLTNLFLEDCQNKGFLGLNGHRSVGGVRVSNYNSISEKMINDFLTHLESFILNK